MQEKNLRKNDKFIVEITEMNNLGCGVGQYSLFFSDLGFDVTSADISERALYCGKVVWSAVWLGVSLAVASTQK